ncbi:MAG: lipocalin-like domain-containing protein [Acidobacteriota bacterium]
MPTTTRRALFLLCAMALAGLLTACGRFPGTTPDATAPPGSTPATTRSAVDALAARDDAPPDPRFRRVLEPRELVFPADHGAHPDYQTEWWYVTANLWTGEPDDPAARRFGLQWTVFRRALQPPPEGEGDAADGPARASAWATRQLAMGHFALTDAGVVAGRGLDDTDRGGTYRGGTYRGGRGHRGVERYARGAAGLAGFEAAPFRIWLEDWSLESVAPPSGDPADASAILPLRLRADTGRTPSEDQTEERLAVDLTLRSTKPVVLQGDRGFSRKGDTPGAASFYYSFTRLLAEGTVTVGEETWPVAGTAWLDHEWSTSVLTAEQTGWDWFSIQLDSGHELMAFTLRLAGGGIDPASSGTLVSPDGTSRPLGVDDFELEVLDRWRSPVTGIEYPSRWRLHVPREDLELEILPVLADQELDISFRYWEGAVDIVGTNRGAAITGHGYVELVGYGDSTEPNLRM